MEADNNIDDLLTRFLFQEAGPEEISTVEEWINKSKENHRHFQELKKTFELLTGYASIGNINVKEEWNHLQRILFTGSHPLLQPVEKPEMSGSVEQPKNQGRRKYRLLIPAAVAASVVALVLTQNFFPTGRNGILPKPPVDSLVSSHPGSAVMQHERNASGSVKRFSLPDGSRIKLSGSSELTYSEATGARQRTVLLSGEADFEVAKDKTKPFIVISGAVSTKAVGTRFTVTAFENEKFIQVHLAEGKVLVKPEKLKMGQQAGGFYLSPGQKLIYDKNKETVKIRSVTGNRKTATGRDNTGNDNPPLPDYNKKSWFMFNNQPLDEIFHSLAFMYDVKILYAKKEVDQRYFVGTFSKSDSVETILHQIAVLNKLTVTRKDNTYTIERK